METKYIKKIIHSIRWKESIRVPRSLFRKSIDAEQIQTFARNFHLTAKHSQFCEERKKKEKNVCCYGCKGTPWKLSVVGQIRRFYMQMRRKFDSKNLPQQKYLAENVGVSIECKMSLVGTENECCHCLTPDTSYSLAAKSQSGISKMFRWLCAELLSTFRS